MQDLLTHLRSEDVTERVEAARKVTQVALDDLELLDALLLVCTDDTALPASMQPDQPDDPFADFFGGASAVRKGRTVAQVATERLVHTGVIGKTATATHLVAALSLPDPGGHLLPAIVKVLDETQWQDRLAVATLLVPALQARDASLYAVIVRFGAAEHAMMVDSALRPYRSRAVNELLNHPASRPLMEKGLSEGIVSGTLLLDEKDAADALTLLLAWDSAAIPPVAQALAERFPWARLPAALFAPQPSLEGWLDAQGAAPLALVQKMKDVLQSREDVPQFPLAAWLRYAGTGVGLAESWGRVPECLPVLKQFVSDWLTGEGDPGLGWEALVVLATHGEHGGIDLAAVFRRDDEAGDWWTPGHLEALAKASPPFPDLLSTFTDVLDRHPTLSRAVLPALSARYDAAALRPLLTRYIERCEASPVVQRPSRPGLRHEERDGVDPVPLQPLVHALNDPALLGRLQDVLPYVRAI